MLNDNIYNLTYALFIIILITIVSCQPSRADHITPPKIDQIELDLADKMKPQRISASFQAFGLKYLCSTNKINNHCVFSFDTASINLDNLISTLRYEVGVQAAYTTKGCHDN